MPFKQFLVAHASGDDAPAILQSCLARHGPALAEASLGFLYATEPLADALPTLIPALRRASPGVHWVGSVGPGVITGECEYHDRAALALMLTDIPQDDFLLIGNPEELTPARDRFERPFAILHGDSGSPEMPEIIDLLADEGRGIFLTGGFTEAMPSRWQVLDGIVKTSISGVAFDGSGSSVITDRTQGCVPIGPLHTITKSDENIVTALDGAPAFKVMRQDIGEVLARDLERIDGYIFAGFPVRNAEPEDYLVRHLLAVDVRGGHIAVDEHLERHEGLIFCRRDGNSSHRDMAAMLQRLKKRAGGQTIRGGIFISCVGRGRHQAGTRADEIAEIRETLGDFPLVGFRASGEIYNGRVYQYTGVLSLFLS